MEFFDEKLNSLCMAWLVDHGKALKLKHFLSSTLFLPVVTFAFVQIKEGRMPHLDKN